MIAKPSFVFVDRYLTIVNDTYHVSRNFKMRGAMLVCEAVAKAGRHSASIASSGNFAVSMSHACMHYELALKAWLPDSIPYSKLHAIPQAELSFCPTYEECAEQAHDQDDFVYGACKLMIDGAEQLLEQIVKVCPLATLVLPKGIGTLTAAARRNNYSYVTVRPEDSEYTCADAVAVQDDWESTDAVRVSNEEISAARIELARMGIACENAGAMSYAACKKLPPNDNGYVALITGNN